MGSTARGEGVGLSEIGHDVVQHLRVPRLEPSGERWGFRALLDGGDGDWATTGGVGVHIVCGCGQ